MRITQVGIRPFRNGPIGLLAVGYIVIDGVLRLNDIELWLSKHGKTFLRWPEKGGFRRRPCVHPLTRELYDEAVFSLSSAYEKKMAVPRRGKVTSNDQS